MRRRELIILIGGGVVAASAGARAQQAGRMRRVGVLLPYAQNDPEAQSHLSAFTQELARLGWSQDRNIRIDARFAAGMADQYPVFANELTALEPDVILSESTPAGAALQQQTRAVAVVFVGVSDPIGSGLVASLARPGGNLTGLMQYESGIMGKWLNMLKEVAPRLARVAFIANPRFRGYDYFLRFAEAAAPPLALELVPTPISNDAAAVERSITSFAQTADGGLLFVPDATIIAHRELVIALAARLRLAGNLSMALFRHGRRPHVLWDRQHRRAAESGEVCRPHPPRREARRTAGAGADQIRNGDQSQNGQDDRTRRPAVAAGGR